MLPRACVLPEFIRNMYRAVSLIGVDSTFYALRAEQARPLTLPSLLLLQFVSIARYYELNIDGKEFAPFTRRRWREIQRRAVRMHLTMITVFDRANINPSIRWFSDYAILKYRFTIY